MLLWGHELGVEGEVADKDSDYHLTCPIHHYIVSIGIAGLLS
jgi:hypothetical protein